MTIASTRLAVSFALMALLAVAEVGRANESNSVAAGGTASAQPQQPCVDVTIGSDRAGFLDCLNQEFRRSVQRQQAHAAPMPAAAGSSPAQIGLFNETAVKEQLGASFGHSVQPQRPEPSYPNSLAR